MCDGPGRVSTYVYGPTYQPFGDPVNYSALTPNARHRKKFNAVFLDGHAESGTYEELYTPAHFTKP